MLIVSGGFVYELLVVWVRLFILLTGDVLDPRVSISAANRRNLMVADSC